MPAHKNAIRFGRSRFRRVVSDVFTVWFARARRALLPVTGGAFPEAGVALSERLACQEHHGGEDGGYGQVHCKDFCRVKGVCYFSFVCVL